jgi:PAS domain S-box-containing protein
LDVNREPDALHRLNRELRAISNCNQILMRAEDEQGLLNDICRIVCDEAGYRMAWVGYAENDDARSVRSVAWAGVEGGYLTAADITWADTEHGRGPTGAAIRSGESHCIQDFETDPQAAPWRENALQRGYRSAIAVPIKDESTTTFGALTIYSTEPNAFTPEEIRLMEALAGDLAFGIMVLRARIERTRAQELIERRIVALTQPMEGGAIGFEDLFNLDSLQRIQDEFALATGVASIITQPDGTPLTAPSNFTHLCNEIIRKTEQGCSNCFKSDAAIGRYHPDGPIVQPCLSGGLWDAGASITVGGHHVANWLIGQVRDETQTEENMRAYARAIGADEAPFMKAFQAVPAMSRERFGQIARALFTLSNQLSTAAYQNVQQARFITERKQAEEERLARLRFVETMDRVNQAIQGSGDIAQMTRDVLEVVLSTLGCDRAWLLYPCDPDSPVFQVPMEVTKPEYPGVGILNTDVPMPPDMAANQLAALNSARPIWYAAGTDKPLDKVAADLFGVQSIMMTALYPNLGKPWAFGLHQCSYPRVWTSEEKELVQEIGRRLTDALSSLLANRELQESEAKYRRIVDAAGEGIWGLGPDTLTNFANARMAEMLGYSCDEMIGRPVTDFMFEEDVPDHLARMENRRRGLSEVYERRFRRKDGETVWTRASAVPVFQDGRRFAGSTAMFTDITERRLAEEERRQSEEKFAAAFHASPDLISITRLSDGTILEVNEGYARLLGYTRAESVGSTTTTLSIWADPEDRAKFVADLEEFGEVHDLETTLLRKDGTAIAVLDSARKFDLMGEECVLSVVHDITDRKRTEEALRESEEQYRTLLQKIEAAVVVHGADTRIVTCNSKAQEIFGLSEDQLLGKTTIDPAWHFTREDGSILPPEEYPATRVVASHEALEDFVAGVHRPHRETDADIWVLVNAHPVFDPEGELAQVIVTVIDITERRRLEEQLRQSQKMEAIGRLAGGVAHDFNNLLTAINGYADMLVAGMAPDDQRRPDVEEIRKAGDRAAALTRRLLAFGRRQVLQPVVVDLNDVVAGIAPMLRRLVGERIELRVARSTDLGRVRADPSQIEQVLLNLVVNARDAMPAGGTLTIETANIELDDEYARTHTLVAPGSYVMLAVSDTGVGMDAATMAHLFEPFFTTKALGEGTGLGLAVVYGIAAASGGHVTPYSEPNRGSVFKVFLPRVEETVERPTPTVTEPAASGAEAILLVEDEDVVRSFVERVLGRLGYSVTTARSGAQALALMAAHPGPIDLLVTDVMLPGMGGREISERLTAQRPSLRTLFISGYTEDSIVHRGELDPGVAFLSKPFTPDALGHAIREVLDGRPTQSHPGPAGVVRGPLA